MFGILLLFVAAERSSVLALAPDAAEIGPGAPADSCVGFGVPFHSIAANYPVEGSRLYRLLRLHNPHTLNPSSTP